MSRLIPFNYQYPADFIGARMKFKPSKSRSISIVKGKLGEQRFFIDQGPIPTATEKQIKRVRWYDSKLKDSDQAELTKGLEVNDKSMLPGKLKIWCCLAVCGQLNMYYLTFTRVEKMERMIKSHVRKWLGSSMPK